MKTEDKPVTRDQVKPQGPVQYGPDEDSDEDKDSKNTAFHLESWTPSDMREALRFVIMSIMLSAVEKMLQRRKRRNERTLMVKPP